MAKKIILSAMLAIALVFGLTAVGCGGDDTKKENKPQTVNYEGKDVAGNTYILTITEKTERAVYTPTEGDIYELILKIIGQLDKISRGSVKSISADGTFSLQPSVEGSGTFNVVISGTGISSVSGDIVVEGGETITPRTFRTLYLRANRWRQTDGSYGEQWDANEINLSDFIKDKPKKGDTLKFLISGKSDKEINFFQLMAGQLNSNYTINSYYYLGASTDMVLPVSFTNYPVEISIINDSDPDVEIIISLVTHMWQKWGDIYQYDNGTTIPEDVPNGTIMATVSDFNISLVE